MEVHASFALSLMFTEANSELVRDAFNVALTFAQRREDADQQLRLLSGFSLYLQQLVDVAGTLDLALRAEAVASKTRKPEDAAIADCMLGPAYYLLGDHLRAQKHLEQALRDPARRATVKREPVYVRPGSYSGKPALHLVSLALVDRQPRSGGWPC